MQTQGILVLTEKCYRDLNTGVSQKILNSFFFFYDQTMQSDAGEFLPGLTSRYQAKDFNPMINNVQPILHPSSLFGKIKSATMKTDNTS